MSSASDQLRTAVKERVVPLLRAHDFKGSFPTWRRSGDRHDMAVVNIQLSNWNHRERATFYVNLALAPDPWLDWNAARFERPRPKTVQERHGLWRQRLDPPRDWRHEWEVHDESSARLISQGVVDRLEEVGLPALVPLLDRAAMIDCLRSGELGEMPRSGYVLYYEMALAVLLADEGPSAELTRLAESLENRPAVGASWPRQRALLLTWLRERASAASRAVPARRR